MLRSARGLGIAWLMLVSCGDVRDAPWELRFETPALRALAVVIEVRILRDGCGGRSVAYEDAVLPGSAPAMPPRLGSGRFGFEARVRDATCTFYAEGCTDVSLPTTESIEVSIAAAPGMPRCSLVDCADGLCDGIDFGEGRPPLAPRVLAPDMGARVASPVRFRFSTVPSVTRYEVVTRACPGPFAGCDLDAGSVTSDASGNVAISLDDGRYGWRVRACDADRCSGWSMARYVDVGARQDVTGDGIGDLLVGAPREPSGVDDNVGAAFAFPGSFGSVGATPVRLATSAEPGARHGFALTSLDVDGDGSLETLVGAPFADQGSVDEGRVVLFPGARVVESSDPRSAATFGSSLASCDIDADGYGDLIVGAPQRDDERGRAEVHFGGPSGFDRVWALGSPTPQMGARFGQSVACGDVDVDGQVDVIVSAPGADRPRATGAGAVYVYSSEGLPFTVLVSPEDSVDAAFGAAVAALGDVDGDGVGDYLVGAPGDRSGSGRAFLFRGRAGMPPLAGDVLINAGGGGGDAFGASVAGGDLNGDGVNDFAIGAPGALSGQGQAYVYLGSARPSELSFRHERLLDGPSAAARFGAALMIVELSADARSDLTVGAPGANAALVYFGVATGVSVSADVRVEPTIANASFGDALGR